MDREMMLWLIGNTDVSGGQEVANHIGPGSQLMTRPKCGTIP